VNGRADNIELSSMAISPEFTFIQMESIAGSGFDRVSACDSYYPAFPIRGDFRHT